MRHTQGLSYKGQSYNYFLKLQIIIFIFYSPSIWSEQTSNEGELMFSERISNIRV